MRVGFLSFAVRAPSGSQDQRNRNVRLTARYLLEQAAEGQPINDDLVAEVGSPADAETELITALNVINQVRAAGGMDAKPLARSVAGVTASRVEEKMAVPPRVRQPAATVDDDEHAEVMRRLEARRLPYGAGYR